MEKEITARNKLIISADDFGMNEKASLCIRKLAKAKKIDRVAVLVSNIKTDCEEIYGLKESGIKLDIHLDLAALGGNHKSVIKRSFLFLYHHLKTSKDEVEKQWAGQIEKFKDIFGEYPDGANSHQHIHFFPSYFKIAFDLCKKNNIPYLRFANKGIIKNSKSVSQILYRLHKKDAKIFSKSACHTSDYLVSLDWIKNIDKFLKNLPEGKTEIICHPERPKEFEIIMRYF